MRESRVLGTKDIRGVLLPVGERYLLLPNAAVAEMIVFQEPEPREGMPDWLLGWIEWRGRQIPVMSWERAVEGREPDWDARRVRIAVLNTLNGNPAVPHIGLLSAGVARLARIRPDTLEEGLASDVTSPLVIASVIITEVPAWIPNLDELERWIVAASEHQPLSA
jgi:chemosensory pili system protein ChpC